MTNVLFAGNGLLKKIMLICGLTLALGMRTFAFTPPEEGMWLPMLVERLLY